MPLKAEPVFLINQMPGRLVSVGTHKLHIYCLGEGSPTVVIDSGLGGFSLEWTTVQKRLAEKTKVCTYDRAGYGWSQAGPEPRTTEQIAHELHRLLINAEIPGPYILVGHSFGGYNIRYFASLYPEAVAGLVLVDASHPDQFNRLPKPDTREENDKSPKNISMNRLIPVIPTNYPEELKQEAYLLMASRKAVHTYEEEWENFRESAEEVNRMNHLPDVPLTVISRGKRVWPHNPYGDKSEIVWSQMQDELAGLTSQSVHLIASKSGHQVHLDEPELVIGAIESTTENAEKNEKLRIAKLQQEKKLYEKTMLLVSNNYLRSAANSYVNPIFGVSSRTDNIHHASFLMSY